jgi:hypothetical protein
LPHQFPRKDKTMNDGVKLLLERMKTHPEEFVGKFNRWQTLFNNYSHVLTEEEIRVIKTHKSVLEREEFTHAVMQELMREPTPVEIDPSTHTINRMGRAPWGTGVTAEQLEALKLQMQTEAEKIRAEHPFQPFCGEVK